MNAKPLVQNASAEANVQRNGEGTHPNQNAQTPRERVEPGGYRRKYSKGQYNNSPFTSEILNAPFQEDFDSARLSKYDRSQDPQVHIDSFDTDMYIRGIYEPLISRISAITLTGAAQAWFSTLPANSIGSFEKFGEKFLLNFATSKKHPKSEFAHGKIRQQPKKTLQRYLNRFKDAALQVPGLQENIHVHLIVDGLDGASRLAKSVYKDPVRTLEEFRTRSKKYLELEQMEIANAQSEDGKRMSPRRRNSALREKESTGNKKKDSNSRIPDDRDRVGRYEKYTSLNASRFQIWREVAMPEMKKVDRPRSIIERKTLVAESRMIETGLEDIRNAVEKFVREGKLRQYVIKTQGSKNNKRKSGNRKRSKSPVPEKKKKKERNQKDDSNNDEFPGAEFDCNMISGALGGGGDTVSARRKYLKEVLSIWDHPKFKEDPSKPDPPLLHFTKEDMQGVLPGHVDGLVVTGILVNFWVKKIFIDAGSSADIILWGAFKKMNLDEKDLKPCKTTLIAFNGENTPPKGYIDIRLTVGKKKAFKSERVRLIVADFPFKYNIILGKPTIHKWDMLVSTKHQKIKW
ncbi:uncharacterized protein LOC133283802 [Gastrolobium bilobum]|uniref:uncharacterized protein LOC133283802 n=1 Tax=Gastrolobium bilobum TaxID=150636 RepID=UPI002AB0A16F|nr:uncharacterized protein LOC133283802 [Gastrolobium bilobum]